MLTTFKPADSKDIIKGLGFTRPIGRLATYIDKLSGGWQMRAQLAKTIQNLNSVDILLLDEPTNHRNYNHSFQIILLFFSN